jgi:predicted acetyltransferase
MIIRKLDVTRPDEALAAMAVSATAFRDGKRYRQLQSQVEQAKENRLPDPAGLSPPQQVWGAYIDDQLASVSTDLSYQMQYEDQVVPMIGIGSVATLPEYRRRGAVRAILSELLREARDQGALFSYLFPFLFSYYDQFGYTTGCCRFRVTCPIAQLQTPPETGRVRHSCADDLSAVQAVYQRFTAGTNGAVVRDQENWRKRLAQDAIGGQVHTYIWQDNRGQDRAWITYETDRTKNYDTLSVEDWAADSMEALAGLFGFLKRYAADYKTLVMNFPLHVNISQLFPEPKIVRIEWEPCGQIRLLNVAAALSLLRRPAWVQEAFASRPEQSGSGELRLQVVDSFLPENDGLYAVDLTDRDKPAVKMTDDHTDYDIKIGIRPLAMLLLGSLGLEQLLEHPEVSLRHELPQDRLDLLLRFFRQKKQGIYDHF